MFNGWTNPETWFFNHYLSEYISDEELSRMAEESVADNSDASDAIMKMAKHLEEILDEIEDDNPVDCSLIYTLYCYARERINILEIAERYIDDYCDDV